MQSPFPATWAIESDPDWNSDRCSKCGKPLKGKNQGSLKIDLAKGILDSDGDGLIYFGSECAKQVQKEFPWAK